MPKRVLRTISNFEQLMSDNQGRPFVYETDEERVLQFNMMAVQSTMRLSDPFELELSYTQAMMGFLLFNPLPQSILMIGLGGGSLQKYCYRNLNNAHIATLEISEDVIALRDKFLVPSDDERFRIVLADAADYLAGAYIRTDIILLDGFDEEGLPDCLCSESFYADCKRALDRQGMLVANLWGSVADIGVYLDRLQSVFNGQVWCARVPDDTNLIAFAFKDESYYPHWPRLMSKANKLYERFGLNLRWLVENMRRRPLNRL